MANKMKNLAKILVGIGLSIGVSSWIFAVITEIDEITINIFLFGMIICAIGVFVGWYVAIQSHLKNKNN